MKIWMRWGYVLCATWLSACTLQTGESSEGSAEDLTQTSQELSKNALSKPQEKIALKAIDDICGDTWCEGDNNFSFDRLQCEKGCKGQAGGCKLTFRVFSYDTDLKTGPTYTRSCRTPGFTGFDSLVETFGDYHALAPAYYDALTNCISQVEAKLPR